MEDSLVRLEPRIARIEGGVAQLDARLEATVEKLHTKIDRVDAKFERKLEALSTRGFTVWVTLISAAATVAAAALAVLFGAAHGH